MVWWATSVKLIFVVVNNARVIEPYDSDNAKAAYFGTAM